MFCDNQNLIEKIGGMKLKLLKDKKEKKNPKQ